MRYQTLKEKHITLTEQEENGEDVTEQISHLTDEIEEIENYYLEGMKIRARIQDYEEGEKSTQYFYKVHKQHTEKKLLPKLTNRTGNLVDGEEKVKVVQDYYTDLYSKTELTEPNPNFHSFTQHINTQIPHDKIHQIGKLITNQEAQKAIQKMKNNKSPGPDGLTKEFYETFWDIIGEDLTEVLNNSFLRGSLPQSSRTAEITLIFKKGDPANIKNWRPISLLNVDYKTCSKVLTERIKPLLAHIIHQNQACGITGRTIHDHLNLISEIIAFVENNGAYRGGISILMVDQQKAFDRTEHAYMFHCLKEYGFGDQFVKWVQTLYYDAKAYVSVNGE